MPGWGLGKKRSRLGKWLDRNGKSQKWLEKEAGLAEDTISRLTKDEHASPNLKTMKKILDALRREGHKVNQDDFWPM